MGSSKLLVLCSTFILSGVFLLLATPALAGYGESGDPRGASAPVCSSPKPTKPWLYYAEAVSNTQVKLVWDQNALASSWTVAYGYSSGNYIYGRDRFGDNSTRSITINELPRGTYYFVVRANNGCMPGPFSDEKVVRVGGGGGAPIVQLTTTRSTVATPTPTPKQISGLKAPTPTVTPIGKGAPVTSVTPTVKPGGPTPTVPVPTPTPAQGILQSILNFLRGLFGR